ncbi:MAG: dienelactone hydrolase family protein, partial [Planctomycetota bacterium]
MKIRQMYILIVSVLVVCISSCIAHSQANQSENPNKVDDRTLERLVSDLLNAKDADGQNKITESLLNAHPSIDKIEELIKRGREYEPDVKTGWQIGENTCLDGESRPYHFYIPNNYKHTQKYPVIIFLHGGVSSPQIMPDEYIKEIYNLWVSPDQAEDLIYVIPVTSRGAEWWTEPGAHHIIDSIENIKLKYNVDENRIYISGFSDGGSGVYYMALHHNTNFAGFISLNGFLPVAQMGGQSVYLPNLRNKPIYAVNTGNDQLYPPDEVKPYIEEMGKADVPITVKNYPDISHSLEYWGEEKPFLIDFMHNNVRNPFPAKLSLETDNMELRRVHWVQI